MYIAQEIFTTFNDDPDLLKKILNRDESWVYDYDIETNAQSQRFATIKEIKEKSKQELLVISKSEFQKYFEDWKKCWHKCFISEKSYFDENKIVIDK